MSVSGHYRAEVQVWGADSWYSVDAEKVIEDHKRVQGFNRDIQSALATIERTHDLAFDHKFSERFGTDVLSEADIPMIKAPLYEMAEFIQCTSGTLSSLATPYRIPDRDQTTMLLAPIIEPSNALDFDPDSGLVLSSEDRELYLATTSRACLIRRVGVCTVEWVHARQSDPDVLPVV